MKGFLLSFVFFAFAFAIANSLIAKLHPTKLPRKLNLLRPFFDGNDTIYTFGGAFPECSSAAGVEVCEVWDTYIQDIFQFSITTGELKVSEAQLEKGQYYGWLLQDEMGMIYHLCGHIGIGTRTQDIHRYNPITDEFSYVGKLAHNNPPSPFAYKLETNEIIDFIVFGPTAMIQNLHTGESRQAKATGYDKFMAYSGVQLGDKFYIGNDKKYFVFDVEKEEGGVIPVPDLTNNHVPAGSDSNGNIWGAFNPSFEAIFSIFRYNVANGKLKVWDVDNASDLPTSHGVSHVYVEKQNRIYVFGGNNGEKVIDAIWFIDLEDLEA